MTASGMRRTLLLALLLLAIGGGIRLWASEHARFTGDESDYWAKSRQVATGQFLPIYGPEITGSAAKLPGPAYYYLMAIPQALSASPRAGNLFVIALHLLSGWLLFCMARSARSERAGLIALALFMLAPWDILYSDRIWGSCVVPAWGALALYATHRSRDSTAWQGILLFVSAVLPQLHLSVPVLWLVCIVLLILRPPKKIGYKALGIASALTVLAYAPPLIAELTSGFANSQAILAKGGGAETVDYALLNPLRVLGYMVLYGSGEIGYHFARGYWGGGFDNAGAYFSSPGWARFFAQNGLLMGALGIISIGLSLIAWTYSLGGMFKELWLAFKARSRAQLSLDRALTAALFVGFVGGGVLLFVAKKRFFPHYANILMPIALWPVASALDRAFDRPRLRPVAGAAILCSLAFMAHSIVGYYTKVDSLNGMANTLSMVKAVLQDDSKRKISFTHFNNRYAWNVVAKLMYGQPLRADSRAPVRWVVDNRQPFEGPVPEGGQVHGSVLLRRTPATGDGEIRGSQWIRDWEKIQVEVEDPAGQKTKCTKPGPQTKSCRYGTQPWRRFGPEYMQVGGQQRALLFMHPVQGSVVTAEIPMAAGTKSVTLKWALTDSACASPNRLPVRLRLLDGSDELEKAEAGNEVGLHSLTATRSSTAAGLLSLELRAEHEGARIFGFDLVLSP